jgi:hypothetical protein
MKRYRLKTTDILTLSDRARKATATAAALATHRSFSDTILANNMQTKENEEDDCEKEGHQEENWSQCGMHEDGQNPSNNITVQHILEGREARLLGHCVSLCNKYRSVWWEYNELTLCTEINTIKNKTHAET